MASSVSATGGQVSSGLAQMTRDVAGVDPQVRGSDWQTGVVTAVNSDGTVNVGTIHPRRLDSYTSPAVGDWIVMSQSSNGNWAAYGRLAQGSPGPGVDLFARKTSDTSRASTTTATADPHLTFQVATNAVYTFDGYLIFLADINADIRIGFSPPTGATGAFTVRGPDLSATSGTTAQVRIQSLPDFSNTIPNGGESPTYSSAHPMGTLVTGATGGTFALIWCQNTSSTTASQVLTNSWLRLTRVA